MHCSTRLNPRRLAPAMLVLALAAGQLGCVRRRMTIRSDPPGAVVYVDERRVGVTPVSTAFTYYGTRKIQLVKDGFETVTEMHKFKTPWYEYPVVDFFSENLWPNETRDERILDFQLPPQQSIAPAKVLERAGQLRANAQRGIMTPLAPAPHPLGKHRP